MTEYKNIFKCSQCGQLSSFVTTHEIPKNSTFEANCLCGTVTHEFYETIEVSNETVEVSNKKISNKKSINDWWDINLFR